MPRSELYPVKKIIGFTQQMLDALEKWRAKQKPIPTASEAIRRMVEKGLASAQQAGPRGKEATSKASKMAGREIDRLSDQSAPVAVRKSRKRRLLKGPKEFRNARVDRPKRK